MGQFKIQEDMIKYAFIKIECKITSKTYFPQKTSFGFDFSEVF